MPSVWLDDAPKAIGHPDNKNIDNLKRIAVQPMIRKSDMVSKADNVFCCTVDRMALVIKIDQQHITIKI